VRSGAVDRFLKGQLEAGISQKRADMMADRMRDRLLKFRSETIARTEGIRAANRGQLQAWTEAADEGLLDASITKRVWIATMDDRTDGVCAALDGPVEFTEPFIATTKAVDFDDIGTTFEIRTSKPLKEPIVEQTPPIHPRCRCSTGLVFDEAEVTTERVAPEPVVSEPSLLTDEQWDMLDPATFTSDLDAGLANVSETLTDTLDGDRLHGSYGSGRNLATIRRLSLRSVKT